MKKINSINLALIFVLFFSVITVAQGKNDKATKSDSLITNAVNNLQQKILLSKKQTSEIKDIVKKYVDVKSNLKDSSKLFSKINSLLDSRQKIKFEIVQNDFWHSILKDLNLQDKDKNK